MANEHEVVKDNVRVWATIGSAVYWAPKGTSLPETPFEDLDPAFHLIGALTEDGPSEGLSVDSNDIKGWPGGQTLRNVNTATDKTFGFTALEEKPVVTRIFYGHGDVVVKGAGATQFAEYDIPDAIGTVEGVMVAVFLDGEDALKVRKMELVQVSERGDRGNSTEGGEGFELTVKVIGKDTIMTTQASYLEEAAGKTGWTVEVTGTPTGGTFTLSVNGVASAGIAYDANAGAVQSALNAISGVSGVTVTGTTVKTVTFTGPVTLTANGAGLTGGSTPGVTVA